MYRRSLSLENGFYMYIQEYACVYILLEVPYLFKWKKPQVCINFNELIVRNYHSSENSKNGIWGEVEQKLVCSAEERRWCSGVCVWGIASMEKNINAVSAK